MKIGFIGCGKMGGSILSGILKSKVYQEDQILLYDVNQETINFWKEKGLSFSDNVKELVESVEMVLVAIKPQMFETLKEYKYDNQDLVVISIAAGKTIEDLKEIFGDKKFIRVMPNTPALIGCGATAISRTLDINDEIFSKVKNIFASIGCVKEISDDQMNEIIPVNGSMPAYLYYFAKCFIDDAVNRGIDKDVAKELASYAIIGSANMILYSGKPVEQLIVDVCSPGGATLKGLEVFDKYDLNSIIKETADETIKRAYELSKVKSF